MTLVVAPLDTSTLTCVSPPTVTICQEVFYLYKIHDCVCPANTAGGTLDDTAAYFDLGPVEVTSPAGIYYYFSTRNNAFTNRDQKANVVVYTKVTSVFSAK